MSNDFSIKKTRLALNKDRMLILLPITPSSPSSSLSLSLSRMIPRRGELPGGITNFTFADDRSSSDEAEFRTWAERINGSYGYFGRSDDLRVGPWARRNPKNYSSYTIPEGEEFRCLSKQRDDDDDDEDSDIPSPTLWEKRGSPATLSSDASPIHNHCNDEEKPLYASSRAQMIDKYRQQMMDLVKDVPENAYELSLKDIVEIPRTAKPGQQSPKGKEPPKDKLEMVEEQKRAKKGAKKKMSRSESMEKGGLLLRMFVPASLGRRKSFGAGAVTLSKVSPKPEKGGADSEWWKRNEFSESSGSSSTGSRGSSARREKGGCNPFFLLLKIKARRP